MQDGERIREREHIQILDVRPKVDIIVQRRLWRNKEKGFALEEGQMVNHHSDTSVEESRRDFLMKPSTYNDFIGHSRKCARRR